MRKVWKLIVGMVALVYALTGVNIALKITGQTAASWWIILAPLWIPPVLIVTATLVVFAVGVALAAEAHRYALRREVEVWREMAQRALALHEEGSGDLGDPMEEVPFCRPGANPDNRFGGHQPPGGMLQ